MRLTVFLAVICLLAACSQPTPPPPSKDSDQALQRTIEEPLQRAKAVEADGLNSQQRVDAALEATAPGKQAGDDEG